MIKNYFCNYEIMNNDVTVVLGKSGMQDIQCSHDEAGWRIILSDTGEKAFKGARIKRLQKYIEGDSFMVTYGDGVASINIGELLNFHHKHGKLATVTGINPASRFGEMKIDGSQVRAFYEKPQQNAQFVNGGFFLGKHGYIERHGIPE
jgi:glucose-1-phosphate cytidylyltransferase